jgi:hypothetical protein
MEELRQAMQMMFQQLRDELQGSQQRRRNQSTDSERPRSSSREDRDHHLDDAAWEDLLVDIPLAPELTPASIPKILKLAKEVKRRSQVITAGRDLHDIHTVLYLIGHWNALQPSAQHYAAHRLRLFYVAITRDGPRPCTTTNRAPTGSWT